MSKPELTIFNNMALRAHDEVVRLQDAVFEHSAGRIEMGADSYMYDFFEGNVFAMARHLDIPIKAPFDNMGDDEAFALIKDLEKPSNEKNSETSLELISCSEL